MNTYWLKRIRKSAQSAIFAEISNDLKCRTNRYSVSTEYSGIINCYDSYQRTIKALDHYRRNYCINMAEALKFAKRDGFSTSQLKKLLAYRESKV